MGLWVSKNETSTNFVFMKKSAGILLYRIRNEKTEIFLIHPGGPFWSKKDLHAWSVPKGEFTDEEDTLVAAQREFLEETGITLSGEFTSMKPVTQKGGKTIFCYACKGDLDAQKLKSNTFEIEWPPHSGKKQSYPEIDRGGWFSPDEARLKINETQAALIDELEALIRIKTV
jgi:predicted NUDIX family NTP pyrophosphohydrolase